MQAESGVGCPISMTYSAIPALRKQPELAEEWEPRFLSLDYDERSLPAERKRGALCGMAMTEKQGGSDVRANTTTATPLNGGGPGAEYELVGHKWFCSAPMCDAFLVLAQTDSGISCFLMPRWTPDGERNGFQIQRLKDKLGNRSNASSELEFRGAWARMVGEEGRGVPTIIEMVNHTRLDCVIGAATGYRAGVAQALNHTAHRSAFGAELIEQPLMRNVLADLCVESEAATIAAMRLARAYDEVAAGDEEAVEFRRLANAVLKYWLCKRAPWHAVECLECLGGNGYVEESGMPRLYREAPLASIWEGSGNVQCLDVLRAMVKDPASVEAFFAEVLEGAGAEPKLDAYVVLAAGRDPRRHRDDRVARAPDRRTDGARPAGLAAGPLRRPGGGRRLLRLAPLRRLGQRVRHASGRHRLRPHHRAAHARVLTLARGVAQGAAHLLSRDHAAELAFRVDREDGAEAAQGAVGEEGVEGGVVADLEGAVVALEDVGDERGCAGGLRDLVGFVADDEAEEAVGGVDDREPGPAVAEEVLVEGLLDA